MHVHVHATHEHPQHRRSYVADLDHARAIDRMKAEDDIKRAIGLPVRAPQVDEVATGSRGVLPACSCEWCGQVFENAKVHAATTYGSICVF